MDQNKKKIGETYSSEARADMEWERYPLQNVVWSVHSYRLRIGRIYLNVNLFW